MPAYEMGLADWLLSERNRPLEPPAKIYEFNEIKSHQPIIAVLSGYNQERNELHVTLRERLLRRKSLWSWW